MSAFDKHNSNREDHRNRGECPTFEDLGAYFDGALSGAEASNVQNHLNDCDACKSVLADLAILRSALRATSPAVSTRSFQLSDAEAGLQSDKGHRDTSRTRPFPLYPVFTAIAAILVVALFAGDLFFNRDGSDPTDPGTANEVLFINGTPFSPDSNDAEFDAASANEMNDQEAGNEAVAREGESDERFLTGWRVAQLLAFAGLVVAIGLWYFRSGTQLAKIRR